MEWILFVVAGLFMLVGAACIVLVIVQLPGTWIMIALAALIEYLDRFYLLPESQPTFGWGVLGLCVGLALLGETLELLASAAGAKGGGASRAGMIGSLIGGVTGAILLAAPLSVVPVIGTFGGAVLGAILGTFAGAVIGEIGVAQQTMRGSVKPALGASIGRVIGTMSKMGIAMAAWIILTAAAWWP